MKDSLALRLLIAAAVASATCACKPQEKIIRYKPFLATLPGAQTGVQAVGNEPLAPALGDGEVESDEIGGRKIIVTTPRGETILLSRTVRDLMTHVERLLDEGDDELLTEQIFAQELKDHLAGEGRTPEYYVRFLRRHRSDLARLFGRMPFAENTPTVLFKTAGQKRYVLKLQGQAARDTHFTELWVTMELGHYKLLAVK